jgi:hypothetical protein
MDPKHPILSPAKLRAQLAGRRAILVSNRGKSTIDQWLREHLGLTVEVIETKRQRKLESARNAIRSGRCDLVLVVTEFVGHNVEYTLKPICKQLGVPFVAIGKGRPQACLIALGRALSGNSSERGTDGGRP